MNFVPSTAHHILISTLLPKGSIFIHESSGLPSEPEVFAHEPNIFEIEAERGEEVRQRGLECVQDELDVRNAARRGLRLGVAGRRERHVRPVGVQTAVDEGLERHDRFGEEAHDAGDVGLHLAVLVFLETSHEELGERLNSVDDRAQACVRRAEDDAGQAARVRLAEEAADGGAQGLREERVQVLWFAGGRGCEQLELLRGREELLFALGAEHRRRRAVEDVPGAGAGGRRPVGGLAVGPGGGAERLSDALLARRGLGGRGKEVAFFGRVGEPWQGVEDRLGFFGFGGFGGACRRVLFFVDPGGHAFDHFCCCLEDLRPGGTTFAVDVVEDRLAPVRELLADEAQLPERKGFDGLFLCFQSGQQTSVGVLGF